METYHSPSGVSNSFIGSLVGEELDESHHVIELVLFKSCKLESKTRGKALGKVDTLETYHAAGGHEVGTTHQGAPGPPGAPR